MQILPRCVQNWNEILRQVLGHAELGCLRRNVVDGHKKAQKVNKCGSHREEIRTLRERLKEAFER